MTSPTTPPPAAASPEGRSASLSWLSRVLCDPELEGGRFETGGVEEIGALERERFVAPRGRLVSDYRRIFGHTPGGACPIYEMSWLKAGDFAAEQDLPWIIEEVIQRSVEEERQLGARRVMEAELDELRLQYAHAASCNDVADSDSSDFGFFDSD